MYFRLRIITLILLPLLLAGVIIMEDKGDNTMAKTEHQASIHTDIPLIDRNVPTVIETATFALG